MSVIDVELKIGFDEAKIDALKAGVAVIDSFDLFTEDELSNMVTALASVAAPGAMVMAL